MENPLKARVHMAMDGDKEFWHRRPLPREALEYAALDVLLMLPTYGAIISWLSDADLIQLRALTNERIANMNAAVLPEAVVKFGERVVPKYGVGSLDRVCGCQHTALLSCEGTHGRCICVRILGGDGINRGVHGGNSGSRRT